MIKRYYKRLRYLIKEFKFRRKYGHKSIDIYNLDYAVAKFTLPMLKIFREKTFSYPHDLTPKEWKSILDDMIYAFEFKVNEWDIEDYSKVNFDRVKSGFSLFGKYFRDLWI